MLTTTERRYANIAAAIASILSIIALVVMLFDRDITSIKRLSYVSELITSGTMLYYCIQGIRSADTDIPPSLPMHY